MLRDDVTMQNRSHTTTDDSMQASVMSIWSKDQSKKAEAKSMAAALAAANANACQGKYAPPHPSILKESLHEKFRGWNANVKSARGRQQQLYQPMEADEVSCIQPTALAHNRPCSGSWSSLSGFAKPAGTVLLSLSRCESTQTNAAVSLNSFGVISTKFACQLETSIES